MKHTWLGMLTAYCLSMLAAVLFHYRLERPLLALGRARREGPAVSALLDANAESNEG